VQAQPTGECLDFGSRYYNLLLALAFCASGKDGFIPSVRCDIPDPREPIEFFQIKGSTVWVLSVEGEVVSPLELTQSVGMRQRLEDLRIGSFLKPVVPMSAHEGA